MLMSAKEKRKKNRTGEGQTVGVGFRSVFVVIEDNLRLLGLSRLDIEVGNVGKGGLSRGGFSDAFNPARETRGAGAAKDVGQRVLGENTREISYSWPTRYETMLSVCLLSVF